MKRKIIIFLTATFLFASVLSAQTTIIKKIKVEGNKVVPDTDILGVVSTRIGDDFSSTRLREEMKSIFKMGYFSDVSLDVENLEDGLAIIFKLKEKKFRPI